jgi:hypothetical protein
MHNPSAAQLSASHSYIWLACFLLSTAYLATGTQRLVDPYDEGNLLTAGFQVSRGLLPYRDFWTIYSPLQSLVLGALFYVFGPELWAARAWDVAVKALLCAEIFAITSMLLPAPRSVGAGLAAALVSLLWLERAGLVLYPVFPALLFCLLALRFAASAASASFCKQQAFFAGVCAGLALAFRHDFSLYLLPALVWLACRRTCALGSCWRSAALGLSLPLFCLLGFLIYCGLERSYYCLVYFPSRVFGEVRALSPTSLLSLLGLGSWDEALSHPERILVSQALPLYFPFLALALWLLRPRNCQDLSATKASTLPALGFSLCLFSMLLLLLQTSVRHDFAHVLPAYLPSLALLCSAVGSQFGRRKVAAVLFLSAALLLLVPLLAIPLRAKLQSVRHSLTASTAFPGREAAVEYIRTHTPEDARLFVALPRHDQITRSDTALYFLSRRLPASYWAELHPGEVDRSEIQVRLLAELEAQRLEFIVRAEPFPWEAAPLSAPGGSLIDSYVREHYQETWREGQYAVLQRHAGSSE